MKKGKIFSWKGFLRNWGEIKLVKWFICKYEDYRICSNYDRLVVYFRVKCFLVVLECWERNNLEN